MKRSDLARRIDHTLLRPDATADEVEAHCREAVELGVATACVSPSYVALAKRVLEGSGVGVCTVIGFPSGAHASRCKAFEAKLAVGDGADEIDMVVHRGALNAGDDEAVLADIRGVVEASQGRPVKVILESAALDEASVDRASRLSARAGASFVKTSTGFGPGGASETAVRCMRAAVGPELGVKASGGIRDATTALAMLEAGATRLGASATRQILDSLDAAESS